MFVVNTTSATAGAIGWSIRPRKRVPSSRRRNPGKERWSVTAVRECLGYGVLGAGVAGAGVAGVLGAASSGIAGLFSELGAGAAGTGAGVLSDLSSTDAG